MGQRPPPIIDPPDPHTPPNYFYGNFFDKLYGLECPLAARPVTPGSTSYFGVVGNDLNGTNLAVEWGELIMFYAQYYDYRHTGYANVIFFYGSWDDNAGFVDDAARYAWARGAYDGTSNASSLVIGKSFINDTKWLYEEETLPSGKIMRGVRKKQDKSNVLIISDD